MNGRGRGLNNQNLFIQDKILFPKNGNLRACLYSGDALIDDSVVYYGYSSNEEGYYLLGVLNAPILAKNVAQLGATGAKGSTRMIQMRPVKNFPIPKYVASELQRKIIALAKDCEKQVQRIINDWIEIQFKKFNSCLICPYCEEYFKPEKIDDHLISCDKKDPLNPNIKPLTVASSEDIIIKSKRILNFLQKNQIFLRKREELNPLILDLINEEEL